ncbi:unnamed protein product [Prorocentrum cordatum]|uniref:Uncharacterized protein n=1 Tax=Prorocentrum cordatum TaxID=2364126 RepID=A0ABN9VUN9_9DINO|nr:unnamed protein product [Polarella glacialis]
MQATGLAEHGENHGAVEVVADVVVQLPLLFQVVDGADMTLPSAVVPWVLPTNDMTCVGFTSSSSLATPAASSARERALRCATPLASWLRADHLPYPAVAAKHQHARPRRRGRGRRPLKPPPLGSASPSEPGPQ